MKRQKYNIGDVVSVDFALGRDIVTIVLAWVQFIRYRGLCWTYRVANAAGHEDVIGQEFVKEGMLPFKQNV